ncbi:MobA/MobL family protein [Priestia flexa]|uniref:MobA/MobL family protein n=1 Tax=Priestia flexa TaxID=86664 RepID=UPI003FD633ED
MKEKIFHLSIKNYSRMNRKTLKTESCVKKGAYRVGMDLIDEKTGIKYERANKGEKENIETVTLLSKDSSGKFNDPAYFYNEIEKAEKRKDARYFKEIELSLFRELLPEENKKLALQLSQEIHQKYNLPVQINYHKLDSSNPHAHIVIPLRPIEGEHFSSKKNRKINSKEFVKETRRAWHELANEKFKEKNLNLFVDHRSYQERGSKKIAQRHVFTKHISEEHKKETLDHNEFVNSYNKKIDLQNIKREKKQDIQVVQIARKSYREEVRNSMAGIEQKMTIHKLYRNEIDDLRDRHTKRKEIFKKQKEKVLENKKSYRNQKEIFKGKKEKFKSNVFHKKLDYQELKFVYKDLKSELKATSIFDFKQRKQLKRQLVQNRIQQKRKKLEIKREKSRYNYQKNLLKSQQKELAKSRREVFKTNLQQVKDVMKMKKLNKEQSRVKNKVIEGKVVSLKEFKKKHKLEIKPISKEKKRSRAM